MAALRAFAVSQSEIGRRFARDQQLHTTDAAAMVEILTAEDRGQPLTPARLAERIALSTGATSTLLNRLEGAGHIVRARGHSDRRVVTLHVTPASHQLADAFYAPLGDQLDTVIRDFASADLDVLEELLSRLCSTMQAHLDTGDDPPAPSSEPDSGPVAATRRPRKADR